MKSTARVEYFDVLQRVGYLGDWLYGGGCLVGMYHAGLYFIQWGWDASPFIWANREYGVVESQWGVICGIIGGWIYTHKHSNT